MLSHTHHTYQSSFLLNFVVSDIESPLMASDDEDPRDDAPSYEQEIAVLQTLAPIDSRTAHFLLQSAGGNIELALNLYGDFGATAQAGRTQPHMTSFTPRPRAAIVAPNAGQRTSNSIRTLAMRVLRLPAACINTGLGLALAGVTLGMAMAGFVGDRVLPRGVMTNLRGAFKTLTTLPEDLDPSSQARKFIHSFKLTFGDRHPRFVESGFKQAISQAKSEFKFVFVYLHSHEHQDTDSFCSEVLCSPDVVSYVNENFVSWGGDVRFSDAFHISNRLNVTGYPYIALLNTTPSNQVQLLAVMQGKSTTESILSKLAHATERHGAVLTAQRLELQEREYARRLREEQNAEYEQSLAADREREAKRQQQQQLEEQERYEREEAERRARAEEQAEQQRIADTALCISRRREEKRSSLPAEPEANASSSGTDPTPTAMVRLRLPDGGSTQRRFLATHRMHHLFDFVDSLESTSYLKYNLVSSYPRKIFAREEADLTLEEAGLAPQAALFVQPEE